ncbi:hypothetical protein [Pseudomonas sp. NPDC089569]|uniref:hypothetical protein n=1 Tax=Pseudomonas sp. NPDC089569 TaxID=3390722 RepID=UPI003CFF3E73
MKDTRILRGAPNRAVPVEVLKKYIERLGTEIVSVTNGGAMFTGCILRSWREQDGVYEIVFCETALRCLKATDDPRLDIVDTLFSAIEEEPVVKTKSPGWFANVKSPVGELTTTMAYVWFACTIAGPLLTYIDSPTIVQLGKGLMMMSLGYLIFGLGLKRSAPSPLNRANTKKI